MIPFDERELAAQERFSTSLFGTIVVAAALFSLGLLFAWCSSEPPPARTPEPGEYDRAVEERGDRGQSQIPEEGGP